MCISPWYHTKYKSLIPCGGCVGCRVDRAILWRNRAKSELLLKGRSAFVTLTYDTEHLHFSNVSPEMTLCRDDVHKFLDNLRNTVKRNKPIGSRPDFSYFLCGEYGGRFERPHYHALFFGLDFYNCLRLFKDLWSHGSVKSLPVQSGSIDYVTDYVSKRYDGGYAVELYDDKGIERPFCSVSRGFGSSWIYSHADEINEFGAIKINGRCVQVPTYYRNVCKRFVLDDVMSRDIAQVDRYRDKRSRVKALGFPDVRTFDKVSRRSKSAILTNRLNRDGEPIDSSFVLDDDVFGEYVLSGGDFDDL